MADFFYQLDTQQWLIVGAAISMPFLAVWSLCIAVKSFRSRYYHDDQD